MLDSDTGAAFRARGVALDTPGALGLLLRERPLEVLDHELLEKVPAVDPASIDDVMCGAVGAGEQAMNLGRNIGALAGLPDTIPGVTVNRFCASSLQTIRMAFHAIKAGEGDTYVAAGVASMFAPSR